MPEAAEAPKESDGKATVKTVTRKNNPRPRGIRVVKSDVVRYADRLGSKAAAERYGVSTRSIYRWRLEKQMAVEAHDDLPPATDLALRSPDWLARREALGNRYGDIAVEAVEMAAQFINEREPDKAQKSLISAGIATDKAQLLRGAATNRSEKVLTIDAQMSRLMDALGRIESRGPQGSLEPIVDVESEDITDLVEIVEG